MNSVNLRAPAVVLMVAGVCAPCALLAQSYPSQPIELVAHTAPGGGTDQFVRLMAEIFTREKMVSQAPVISNRAGGGGAIAYNYVKGKKGDPHVVLAVATGTHTQAVDLLTVGALAAEVMAEAIVRATHAATGIPGYPAARDLINTEE